jgi:type II secretory pathway pseudopilin PulG
MKSASTKSTLSAESQSKRGMTLIELSIITGIASLLFAMILGLSHHVTAVSNIRKAQAELGKWQLALDEWRHQFGEYPTRIIRENGEPEAVMTADDELGNLSNVYYKVSVVMNHNNSQAEVHFREIISQPVEIFDPWGTPYVYLPHPGRQSYKLFSCGPDAQTPELGDEDRSAYDDIHFER